MPGLGARRSPLRGAGRWREGQTVPGIPPAFAVPGGQDPPARIGATEVWPQDPATPEGGTGQAPRVAHSLGRADPLGEWHVRPRAPGPLWD